MQLGLSLGGLAAKYMGTLENKTDIPDAYFLCLQIRTASTKYFQEHFALHP